MGGALSIEDVEVLAEHVDEVTCRWCGTGTSVAAITEAELAEVEAVADESTGPDPA